METVHNVKCQFCGQIMQKCRSHTAAFNAMRNLPTAVLIVLSTYLFNVTTGKSFGVSASIIVFGIALTFLFLSRFIGSKAWMCKTCNSLIARR